MWSFLGMPIGSLRAIEMFSLQKPQTTKYSITIIKAKLLPQEWANWVM